MISYQSPITHFNHLILEDLSLKVAELEALLMVLNDMGTLGESAGNVASAAERLAHWLQADVQALITARNSQQSEVETGGAL